MLGLWIEQTEGAKFWLKVMNELKTRGVNDVLIAVVDGLKGFPEAIGTVFPLTTVQTCIIHLIRNSLAFVSWKDRKLIMPDLKAIYRAETAEAAAAELDAFEAEWGKRYPAIGQAWQPARPRAVVFLCDCRVTATAMPAGRRSGICLARLLFDVRCSGADGSCARLRFRAAIKSITGDGVDTARGLMGSPFILASISCCNAS